MHIVSGQTFLKDIKFHSMHSQFINFWEFTKYFAEFTENCCVSNKYIWTVSCVLIVTADVVRPCEPCASDCAIPSMSILLCNVMKLYYCRKVVLYSKRKHKFDKKNWRERWWRAVYFNPSSACGREYIAPLLNFYVLKTSLIYNISDRKISMTWLRLA